jgi:hypothetical protein
VQLQLETSEVEFGQMNHGEDIGDGIQKRLGPMYQ